MALPSPPSYVSGETSTTILARLIQSMNDQGYAVPVGSVWYQVFKVFAALLYDVGVVSVLAVVNMIFIDTAPEDTLPDHAIDKGIPALPATPSTTTLNFTGTNGTVIPTGTLVSTASVAGAPAVIFKTLSPATIAGGVANGVPAESVDTGFKTNVGIGKVIFPPSPVIVGLASVTNPTVAIGGADAEDPELYRARAELELARDPGMMNLGAYEQLIIDQPGVGYAHAIPDYGGAPDAIGIVILADDHSIPPAPFVAAFQETIDPTANPGKGYGLAAHGDFVTIIRPTAVNVTITVPSAVLESGTDIGTWEAAVQAAFDAEFGGLQPAPYIGLQDQQALVDAVAGTHEFGDLLLNGSHASLQLTDTQVAVLQPVVFSPAPTVL